MAALLVPVPVIALAGPLSSSPTESLQTRLDPAGPDLDATLERVRKDPDRIAAVHATGLLDSEVEEVFDRLTRLAVRLVRVPASFISLVDSNRDFYKSTCGFGEPLASTRQLEGPTFCHFTVQRREPLVIPDTAGDPRYRDVPTVRTLGVAAYVGVPLVVEGQTVGAFCTIDTKPRAWTVDEVEVLQELAASAQREIELRGAIARVTAAHAAVEEQRAELEQANHLLHEQTVELEMQAEELRATTAHLEERTEEAETANKVKAGFLSMMSHELRTPLNAIGGYADLLILGVHGAVSPGQTDYLARIKRASRHLQTLIGDILEFSRLDSGQVRYELTSVTVEEAIAAAAELVSPQVSEAGVSFEVEPCPRAADGAPLAVRADPARLRQILVNLLANALKFTPAAGRVWVSCTAAGSRARIAVSDTGRGIPADDLPRVFEAFVQIDREKTDSRHQGVGLGLAICRELARGMHGELSVTSELGVGSTFTLELPAIGAAATR